MTLPNVVPAVLTQREWDDVIDAMKMTIGSFAGACEPAYNAMRPDDVPDPVPERERLIELMGKLKAYRDMA